MLRPKVNLSFDRDSARAIGMSYWVYQMFFGVMIINTGCVLIGLVTLATGNPVRVAYGWRERSSRRKQSIRQLLMTAGITFLMMTVMIYINWDSPLSQNTFFTVGDSIHSEWRDLVQETHQLIFDQR